MPRSPTDRPANGSIGAARYRWRLRRSLLIVCRRRDPAPAAPRSVRRLPGPFAVVAVPASTSRRVSGSAPRRVLVPFTAHVRLGGEYAWVGARGQARPFGLDSVGPARSRRSAVGPQEARPVRPTPGFRSRSGRASRAPTGRALAPPSRTCPNCPGRRWPVARPRMPRRDPGEGPGPGGRRIPRSADRLVDRRPVGPRMGVASAWALPSCSVPAWPWACSTGRPAAGVCPRAAVRSALGWFEP